jgi:hypothetical protein
VTYVEVIDDVVVELAVAIAFVDSTTTTNRLWAYYMVVVDEVVALELVVVEMVHYCYC